MDDTSDMIDSYERRVSEREEERQQQRMRRKSFGKQGNFRLIAITVIGLVALLVVLYAVDFLGLIDLPFPNFKQTDKSSNQTTDESLNENYEWTLDLEVTEQEIRNAMGDLGFEITEMDSVEGRKNYIGTKGTSYVQYFKHGGKVELALINVQITDDLDTNDTKKDAIKTFSNTINENSTDTVLEGFNYVIEEMGKNYYYTERIGRHEVVIKYEVTTNYNSFVAAYLLPEEAYEEEEEFELRGEIIHEF